MNVPIDTLAFADRFESAGFAHDQARALAAAFGHAQDSTRDGLVTKDHLDARLAEMEGRLNKQLSDGIAAVNERLSDNSEALNKQLFDSVGTLTRQIADNGKDISGRLWSTVTIIAGVSTAISATVGAAVALLLKMGGL